MTDRIRQAFAAALLAFFINISLAAGAGANRSEEAMRIWLARPAIVLAYDPDDISGELHFMADFERDPSAVTEEWAADEDAPPVLAGEDESLSVRLILAGESVESRRLAYPLEAAEALPDPSLDPSGYDRWLLGYLSPRQALYLRIVPNSLELAADEYDLRWRKN